jgi:hypothetical protein
MDRPKAGGATDSLEPRYRQVKTASFDFRTESSSPVIRRMQIQGPLDSLCAAISAETGMPSGRIKKVVLALQRHQSSTCLESAPGARAPSA